MNEQQLIDLYNDGKFSIPDTTKDSSVLITNNKYFPGIPLYPKVYNGVTSYIGAFGKEFKRIGLTALYRIEDHWYLLPLPLDLVDLKKLREMYSKATLLTGFAENVDDAKKLERIATSLSTPLEFSGGVSVESNEPTKRFPESYSIKVRKNPPFKPDYDSALTQLDDFDWDS